MNEHRKDVYTDYEPNFIMRDADVPDETETEKNQHQEFTAASQYSDGAYKDPRENFRKTKPADKYYADSSGQNNSASSQYTYRRNSSDNPDLSGSWDSTNGYKRTRKYRRSKSKSSTPITLTKKSVTPDYTMYISFRRMRIRRCSSWQQALRRRYRSCQNRKYQSNRLYP